MTDEIQPNDLVTNGVTRFQVIWLERRYEQDGAMARSLEPGDGWGLHWVHLSSLRKILPSTHGDPFLSPWQTNPTAGTPEGAAAQLDMAGDLDRALKAREDEGRGRHDTRWIP